MSKRYATKRTKKSDGYNNLQINKESQQKSHTNKKAKNWTNYEINFKKYSISNSKT